MSYENIYNLKRWKFKFSHERQKVNLGGRVFNHPRFCDGTYITTTRICVVEIFETFIRVYTRNSIYDCYFENYDVLEIDEIKDYSEVPYFPLPEKREEIGAKLRNKLFEAATSKVESEKRELISSVDDNNDYTLVELSSEECYYFKAIYVKTSDGALYARECNINLGMFRDSVLIMRTFHQWKIDIRYFTEFDCIKFYRWNTNIDNVYIKNAGDEELVLDTPVGIYVIPPHACYRIASDSEEGLIGLRVDASETKEAIRSIQAKSSPLPETVINQIKYKVGECVIFNNMHTGEHLGEIWDVRMCKVSGVEEKALYDIYVDYKEMLYKNIRESEITRKVEND